MDYLFILESILALATNRVKIKYSYRTSGILIRRATLNAIRAIADVQKSYPSDSSWAMGLINTISPRDRAYMSILAKTLGGNLYLNQDVLMHIDKDPYLLTAIEATKYALRFLRDRTIKDSATRQSVYRQYKMRQLSARGFVDSIFRVNSKVGIVSFSAQIDSKDITKAFEAILKGFDNDPRLFGILISHHWGLSGLQTVSVIAAVGQENAEIYPSVYSEWIKQIQLDLDTAVIHYTLEPLVYNQLPIGVVAQDNKGKVDEILSWAKCILAYDWTDTLTHSVMKTKSVK